MEQLANAEQAAAWDGREGALWAEEWATFDRSIREYLAPMLEAAAIRDGEQVLDVGCGNGQTTREAGRRTPSGRVVGIDLSGPMLARARQLTVAEGLTNVDYVQGDAQVHPFEPAACDVAISRFGSMFFGDKPAAFANIGGALRPGGRLLLVVWRSPADNPQFATIRRVLAMGRELPTPPPGAPSPFGLADPDLGRRWLEQGGFVDVQHEAVDRRFDLGDDADAAFRFMSRNPMVDGLTADLDEATRAAALEGLRRAFEEQEGPDGVVFPSGTWFISARWAGA
jgi:SAM-dependent methyltransferase